MPVHHATDAQTLNAIIQQVRTGLHGRGRSTRSFDIKSVRADLVRTPECPALYVPY